MPNLAIFPVLMDLYGKNHSKFCLGKVSQGLETKSINKKKFRFSLKIHDFSEKFFERPKIHFFELRNPVGWVPHVVLALNQWIRPKNGGREKVYRKSGKM